MISVFFILMGPNCAVIFTLLLLLPTPLVGWFSSFRCLPCSPVFLTVCPPWIFSFLSCSKFSITGSHVWLSICQELQNQPILYHFLIFKYQGLEVKEDHFPSSLAPRPSKHSALNSIQLHHLYFNSPPLLLFALPFLHLHKLHSHIPSHHFGRILTTSLLSC